MNSKPGSLTSEMKGAPRASGEGQMLWDDFRTTRFQLEDVDLAVKIAGRGDPLVLLHGFPQHSLMWHAVAPALAKDFTVIVPDQRGLGASGFPSGADTASLYAKSTMARDLEGVLDQLGHRQVLLAGYDLGAGVAIAFAHAYPERVKRLAVMEFVLAGFGLEQAMAPQADWTTSSNWHFGVFVLPDVATWLFRGRERDLLSWFFWHKSYGGEGAVNDAHLHAYERMLARPGVLRAGAGYYAAVWQDAEDNAPLKATLLPMPVLALGGEASTGPVLERLWKPIAVDLRTQVVAKAGHWLCDENPDAVAAALAGFFAER